MSLVPILIRSASANEITIGLARLAIAIALVSPLAWRFGRQPSSLADWRQLALVGIVFGGHWLTYFISIKTASAAIAAVAISTYGIHLLLLQWWFGRQRITPIELGAVLLCFVGCLLTAPALKLSDKLTIGMLVGVFSGFLYACLPLLHQKITHIPTITRAWGQFFFASLIFLPALGYSDWQLPAGDWWRLLILGVVCTVIGHSLWVKVSTEMPAVFTGVVYYLYVPIAMVSSAVFLQELISAKMIAGALCIIAANITIALSTWRRSKKQA